MKKSLKQLETDVKNAKKEKNPLPNDRFSEVMTDFSNQAKVKKRSFFSFPKSLPSHFPSPSPSSLIPSPAPFSDEAFLSQFRTIDSQKWRSDDRLQ